MTETSSTPKRGRRLAATIAGALALGVLPLAMPASAQTTDLPPAQGIATACPFDEEDETTEVPEDGFTDVPASNIHEFSVDCAAWYQITSGQTATTYNPGGTVTRAQMATFIAQVIDYVADRTEDADDGLDPVPASNQFPCDVDTSNTHFGSIQRLAAAGVVEGTGANNADEACYTPNAPVSREAMATFIRQAQDVVGVAVPDPATSDNYFVDDDASVHEDSINAIAKEGIIRGTGVNSNNEPTYSPGTNVDRAQMATFLVTKMDRLLDDTTDVDPPPYATATVTPADPEPDSDVTVDITEVRGTVESSSATGCGETDIANTTGDPLEIVVPIDDDQDPGDCTLAVTVNFDDEDAFGGEDRTQTINLEVEVTEAA